jgi:hypothetical protein
MLHSYFVGIWLAETSVIWPKSPHLTVPVLISLVRLNWKFTNNLKLRKCQVNSTYLQWKFFRHQQNHQFNAYNVTGSCPWHVTGLSPQHVTGTCHQHVTGMYPQYTTVLYSWHVTGLCPWHVNGSCAWHVNGLWLRHITGMYLQHVTGSVLAIYSQTG